MDRILIVEDNIDVNAMLAEVLVDHGYVVNSVYTGTDGLKEIKEQEYNLILLDIMLPYKRGDEILKEVREFSEVPIIIISAKDMIGTKIDLLKLGADDYITKPFDLDEVVARVEANLRRFHKKEQIDKVFRYKDMELDDNAVKTHISNLRSKLKTANAKEEYIETVWGLGYRLFKE